MWLIIKIYSDWKAVMDISRDVLTPLTLEEMEDVDALRTLNPSLVFEDDEMLTFANQFDFSTAMTYDDSIELAEMFLSDDVEKTLDVGSMGSEDEGVVVPEVAPAEPVDEDDDDDNEDDADFNPNERESNLKDTWSSPQEVKRRRRRLRSYRDVVADHRPSHRRRTKHKLFMERVVEGSTHTTPVPWTLTNLQSLWDAIVGKGDMNRFISKSAAYLRFRKDSSTYFPTPLGMKKWS